MKIVIRADASIRMGTGHVMRCIALAQAWQQEGGQVLFVMGIESPLLEVRLQAENMGVMHLSASLGSDEDVRQTVEIAQQVNADWIVVDGYQFGTAYQRGIKDAGFKLLIVDDYGHAEHYCADLVLNQNIGASEDLYANREAYTQLLLGTQYVLLRKEFWPWQGWQRQVPVIARKVLVTLGGSDPENVTLKVIQALQQLKLEELEVVVIVGGSNPHYEQLQAAVQSSSCQISLQQNVTNMPKLMAWADVAIAAGGSTNWELVFMRLPTLIISLA
ncbi:MAG: UDP-2,4-diacetamido-2,4,6-trideoxy-beta-L-altropyranose hydrolase, partial [Leptolyngbyaceae cyanobacterium]